MTTARASGPRCRSRRGRRRRRHGRRTRHRPDRRYGLCASERGLSAPPAPGSAARTAEGISASKRWRRRAEKAVRRAAFFMSSRSARPVEQ
jgi:hypothetical protein